MSLFRKTEPSRQPPPTRYIITLKAHPLITAPKGYLQLHPDEVWRVTKHRHNASLFTSEEQAQACADGCGLACYSNYKIESAGSSLPA